MQPQTPQSNRRPPAPQPFQRAHTPSLAPAQRPQNAASPSTLPPQPTPQPKSETPEQRQAAAQIVKQQVDRIYEDNSPHKAAEEAVRAEQQPANTAIEPDNVYDRTHSNQTAYTHANTDHVKQYHTAWQNYYQKYYERYYMQQLQASRSQIEARATQAAQPQQLQRQQVSKEPETLTKQEAIAELRGKLLDKVKNQAEKARKSRHFLPIMSAVVIALVFVFLQYNRQLVASVQAYVSPGSIAPQNIVLDPTTDVQVDGDPRLIIPKINVDAPVIYGLESIAEGPVQEALDHGVVHYPIPGANSVPGQVGNTAILGHSSNDVFNTGAYKFVFVQLDQLNEGDTFYAHYEGTRYTYSVTGKEVIEPTEVNKLILDTDKPMMTLITCTPPGTALKRLIVYAEQISPDPAAATAAPERADNGDPETIPDYYSPTIFERLFGGFGG